MKLRRCTASLFKILKTDKMNNEEQRQIAETIIENTVFCTKEVLTTDEAAQYMGISKSYLYKLTMRQQIPHFKPMGKMCYFNRKELENWLQNNRISTDNEIREKAQTYCMQKGGLK